MVVLKKTRRCILQIERKVGWIRKRRKYWNKHVDRMNGTELTISRRRINQTTRQRHARTSTKRMKKMLDINIRRGVPGLNRRLPVEMNLYYERRGRLLDIRDGGCILATLLTELGDIICVIFKQSRRYNSILKLHIIAFSYNSYMLLNFHNIICYIRVSKSLHNVLYHRTA